MRTPFTVVGFFSLQLCCSGTLDSDSLSGQAGSERMLTLLCISGCINKVFHYKFGLKYSHLHLV